MHCKTRDIKIEKYGIIQQSQPSYRCYLSDIGTWVLWGRISPQKLAVKGGRTKPLMYSVKHPILIYAGLRHPIIPKSSIIAPTLRVDAPVTAFYDVFLVSLFIDSPFQDIGNNSNTNYKHPLALGEPSLKGWPLWL